MGRDQETCHCKLLLLERRISSPEVPERLVPVAFVRDLRLCPDLIRIICASKLATFRPFGKEFEPWTQQELRQAIE